MIIERIANEKRVVFFDYFSREAVDAAKEKTKLYFSLKAKAATLLSHRTISHYVPLLQYIHKNDASQVKAQTDIALLFGFGTAYITFTSDRPCAIVSNFGVKGRPDLDRVIARLS